MKLHGILLFIGLTWFSCNAQKQTIEMDSSKHKGLMELETSFPFRTLYSIGAQDQAKKQTTLVNEAYEFLSPIMGPKKDFCVLVLAEEDWNKNGRRE